MRTQTEATLPGGTDDGNDLLVGAGAGGGALSGGLYGRAACLDRLAEEFADTTSAHSVLNALAYAFRHDALGDVKTVLEPLVDEWLDESLQTQEQRL